MTPKCNHTIKTAGYTFSKKKYMWVYLYTVATQYNKNKDVKKKLQVVQTNKKASAQNLCHH